MKRLAWMVAMRRAAPPADVDQPIAERQTIRCDRSAAPYQLQISVLRERKAGSALLARPFRRSLRDHMRRANILRPSSDPA